jgi:DNA-binding response OmpR family regulator
MAARDGVEGLDLARQHPLEAVILDIMMPGMSGLEVLERLHAHDPDLPVIMLTAYPSSRNAIAALKLGALDFEVAQLRSRIAELEATRPGRWPEIWGCRVSIEPKRCS